MIYRGHWGRHGLTPPWSYCACCRAHSQVKVNWRDFARYSRATAGRRHFPNLRGRLRPRAFSGAGCVGGWARCDVIFFATGPMAVAMKSAARVLGRAGQVIDLSADFRIRDIDCWEQWYGTAHTECSRIWWRACYGLPEVNSRAKFAMRAYVRRPGCYPPAIQLGPCCPAGKCSRVERNPGLSPDAKSVSVGPGRQRPRPKYLLLRSFESISAYACVAGHRAHP